MAAWGSAPSQEGFAVGLGQSERVGSCQHGGAGGTAGGAQQPSVMAPLGKQLFGGRSERGQP